MTQEITVVQNRAVFAPTQDDYKEMSVGEPQNMLEVRALAEYLAKSKFIPQSFRGDLNTAVMLIVTCKQYNLPITALSEVMEVNGKVGFWGRTKLGIVLKSGVCEYLIATEQTDKKCTIETKRKGWPKEVQVSYTIEQAEKAGLIQRSDAWKKHPSDMLYWRAVSRVISQVYPDVIQGFATVEEAQDEEQIMPQAQAVAMPTELEAPKEKKPRRVKAVKEETTPEDESSAGELVTKVEAEEEKENAISADEIIEPKEKLFEVPETSAGTKAEEVSPTRYLRFVKQVLLEGGVRYIIAKNPLIEEENKWVIPSASMAGALKKLTGMKVMLIVKDNVVISYEEIA